MGSLVFSYNQGVTLKYNGERVAHAGGGGYDRAGTCLGEWLSKAFQDRLQKLFRDEIEKAKGKKNYEYSVHSDNRNRIVYWTSGETKRFYGVYINIYKTIVKKTGEESISIQVGLDGGVGKDCMEKIAKAIGVEIHFAGETSRAANYYVSINDFPEVKDEK